MVKEWQSSENSEEDYVMEKGDLIYSKVEEFIKKIHDKDIELNPKAQSIMIVITTGKDTWGKPIKHSCSLAEVIGDDMAYYQRVKNGESIICCLVEESQKKTSDGLEETEEFIRNIHTRSALSGRKDDVANELFRYIELAYTNNAIDEIGLGIKLKKLEEENANQKRLIGSLEKLNKDLKKENESLHKIIPNYKKKGTEIGDVGT
jgi:hypothetical protein